MSGFQSKRAMASMSAPIRKKHRFWVEQTDLYSPVNRAYEDWFSSPVVGTKYVWFEHHAEILLGFKCRVDYDHARITDIEVVDQNKFLLFQIKFS